METLLTMKRVLLLVLIASMMSLIPAFAQDDVAEDETTEEDEAVVITRDALPDPTQFTLEPVIGGFSSPLFVTNAGDDSNRLCRTNRQGRLVLF